MGFLSKKASASVNAGSSGGGYLQVSKLADGGSVRFALLAAQPLEGYEVWASSPEGQSKPFRFEFEPTPEDIAAELGDFEPREGRGGPGTVDIKFFIAAPVYNFDAGTSKSSRSPKSPSSKSWIKSANSTITTTCLPGTSTSAKRARAS